MENASTRSNPMIMVGLIVAMILLIGAIVLSTSRPIEAVKTVKLASGEWAPYVGESLPDNGVASAIVEFVFKQMGYQTQYQFMPWALVQTRAEQSQTNNQIRGVFPYIQSQQREGQFYFSEGILDIAYGVFFHRTHNPQARAISQHQDLYTFAIMTLQGYKYDDEISQYLPTNSCDLKDTVQGLTALELNSKSLFISSRMLSNDMIIRTLTSDEAVRLGVENTERDLLSVSLDNAKTLTALGRSFETEIYVYWFDPSISMPSILENINQFHLIMTAKMADQLDISSANQTCVQNSETDALLTLAYWHKPKVIIEAIEVGENILSKSLPRLAPFIQLASYSTQVPHRVMFPKNNPNNLGLRDQFNQRLNELRANQQAYEKLVQTTVNKIQLANAVSLVTSGGETLVTGGVFDPQTYSCLFESPVHFPNGSKALVRQWPAVFLNAKVDANLPYVIAKVLNGPLAGSSSLFCFEPDAIKL